jgi:hypothetical protein
VLIFSFVFALVGCSKQAEPIVLPAVDEIDSIEITAINGSQVSYSDKEWIEQLLSVFLQAEATTLQSIQDVPNVENYGKVDISNNGGITTVFYYVDSGKYYIEQPYQGIYETDVDIDALISGVE